MTKILNINAIVTIVLTKKGIDCLNTSQKVMFKIQPYHIRKVIKTELWHIMQIFGPHLHMGQTTLFEYNELLINEDELV
jgi:hypothetical protein